jgi:hypothetical protein
MLLPTTYRLRGPSFLAIWQAASASAGAIEDLEPLPQNGSVPRTTGTRSVAILFGNPEPKCVPERVARFHNTLLSMSSGSSFLTLGVIRRATYEFNGGGWATVIHHNTEPTSILVEIPLGPEEEDPAPKFQPYKVDVVRSTSLTRSFEVEARTVDEAKHMAIEIAVDSVWEGSDTAEYDIASVTALT